MTITAGVPWEDSGDAESGPMGGMYDEVKVTTSSLGTGEGSLAVLAELSVGIMRAHLLRREQTVAEIAKNNAER